MVYRISEDAKEELIERFNKFPVQVVATAWVYAVALNEFGVDVSKAWETVTEQRSALNLAYLKGRSVEREAIYSLEVVPLRFGRWINEWTEAADPHERIRWKCSLCKEVQNEKSKFCPNCGAKMEATE